MTAERILPAIAAAMAMEELDRLKTIGRPFTFEDLMRRLDARIPEFDLVAQAATALLMRRLQ